MSSDSVGFRECPRCDYIVLAIREAGLETWLSRVSVPYRDAVVLHKYGVMLRNVFQIATGELVAAYWYGQAKPTSGRLYTPHICELRP